MCSRCEGRGSVNDIDLTQLYDDSLSLNEGPFTIPGYSMDGWYGRIFKGSGFFDPDKPIAKYTKRELNDLLYKEPTKIKVEGINLTYEGLIPRIQKSMLSKDVDSLQPHVRAFVERAVTFTTCPDCDGTRLSAEARSSKIDGTTIADACAMQITRPGGLGERRSTSRRWRRSSRHWARRSTRSWRSAWAISRSTGRPARCRAARRSGRR